MAENTREIVLDILLELERGGAYSHQLIRDVLDKYDYLPPSDKRFVKRLAEGCVERRIELDYILEQFSTVRVEKMKPLIRCLLRMGVYQIRYMDAVPARAACSEAVKLAGKRGFSGLKGFVNGCLRAVAAREGEELVPDRTAEPVRYLSVKYSMPEWIVNMWLSDYGEAETERILEGLLRVHPVSIRFSASLGRGEREALLEAWRAGGVRLRAAGALPDAFLLENVEGVASLAGYREGAFTVQDVSSQLALMAAAIRPGERVMDLCAAPGGKTLWAAERAGEVLARDVSEKKAALIRENCERMGLAERVTVQVWDARRADPGREGWADVVILDVPCSGLGVLGKKRDIKYRMTPEGIDGLVALQRQIVTAGWRYVKVGGRVLYSTCTIDKRENEEMCRFMEKHFPLKLEESRQILPGEETDGFFYARFLRLPGRKEEDGRVSN